MDLIIEIRGLQYLALEALTRGYGHFTPAMALGAAALRVGELTRRDEAHLLN
jgi:hypothetical protein